MAVTAIAAVNATPFAGLMSSLEALWPRLQESVVDQAATDEERQVFYLIELATSRFGEPLLHAANEDDLDDLLDALTDSPDAVHYTELLARYIPLFQATIPKSAVLIAAATRDSRLDAAQNQTIQKSQPMLEAWLDAQHQAAQLLWSEDAGRISDMLLVDSEIPLVIEELVFHGLRASFCGLAIEQVFKASRMIPLWLASALVERLVVSARHHLTLLASLPGVLVDETIIPADQRLDFAAIAEHHRRACAATQRSYELALASRGL